MRGSDRNAQIRRNIRLGITTLHELEVIRGAIEISPHDTVSLARERVLRFIDLAIEAVKAKDDSTEKLGTEK